MKGKKDVRISDYAGLLIRLTQERLDHILQHPEMVALGPEIEETLSKPERVVGSSSDLEARLYYRFHSGTPVGAKYLCVVVKLFNKEAFVLTAYLTDRIKEGALIWPKKK